MRRRDFIAVIAVSVAWPLAVRAQQERMRRIGVLMNTSDTDPETAVRIAAFEQGLAQLGWTPGRNIQIDYRWGVGDVARTRAAAQELLQLAPDVLVSNATPATDALRKATDAIPIVFVVVSEPVAQGFVRSLARPDGNITGFTYLEPTLGAKWLELLKEVAPRVTDVAIVFNPSTAPNAALFAQSAQTTARRLAVATNTILLSELVPIEPVMTSLAGKPGRGLIIAPDASAVVNRKLIIELAARYQIPTIYFQRAFTVEGGLISYDADITDIFRRAAPYVDRILRGEKPAELPVQQPNKFELSINLKTAKTLGLEVPPKLLFTADQVIE